MELYVQDGPGLRLGLLGTSAEHSRLATGEAAPKSWGRRQQRQKRAARLIDKTFTGPGALT